MRINFDASYSELTSMLRKINCEGKSCGENNVTRDFDENLSSYMVEDASIKSPEIQDKINSNKNLNTQSSYVSYEKMNEDLINLPSINLEESKIEKADINYTQAKINSYAINDFEYEKEIVPPTILSLKRLSGDNVLTDEKSSYASLKKIQGSMQEISKDDEDEITLNAGNNTKLKNVSYQRRGYERYNLVSNQKSTITNKEIISNVIKNEGQKQGIDPALALAVAKVESSMNPNAISRDGYRSKGLFQLLDSTGKDMMADFGNYGKYTPYDIYQNSSLGINYLRQLHTMFSQDSKINSRFNTFEASSADSMEKFAVASFNAGQGRVASAQARAFRNGEDPSVYENVEKYLPSITRGYVKRVMQAKEIYSENV